MTPAQYLAATQRLRANGIELNGTDGTLTKDGITARYQHRDDHLRVEIIDRPNLLPLSLIEAKLRSYLEQSVAYDVERAAR